MPIRDTAGELHSLQFIGASGTKRFLKGGRAAGLYFLIGVVGKVVCIAEGYATGASIHAATGYAVAVAFNAGNLGPVTGAIRASYPQCSSSSAPMTTSAQRAIRVLPMRAMPRLPWGQVPLSPSRRLARIVLPAPRTSMICTGSGAPRPCAIRSPPPKRLLAAMWVQGASPGERQAMAGAGTVDRAAGRPALSRRGAAAHPA
ncbi:MAG: toprim domain-containing protein [Sulfuritalea sp.]|nr:toprim domain-containing protein [Sulfuritalea sp.]